MYAHVDINGVYEEYMMEQTTLTSFLGRSDHSIRNFSKCGHVCAFIEVTADNSCWQNIQCHPPQQNEPCQKATKCCYNY